MKNCEKYKTADERAKALRAFCNSNKTCKRCTLYDTIDDVRICAFHWLELEAEEEKPEPCPFCGGKMQLMFEQQNDAHCLVCYGGCGYTTGAYASEAEAISWNNRVARAVAETRGRRRQNDCCRKD